MSISKHSILRLLPHTTVAATPHLVALLLTLLTVWGSHTSAAQTPAPTHQLSGIIRTHSGERLMGAAVYVVELQRVTMTDKHGHYQHELPSGIYTLRYSAPGYITQTERIELRDAPQEHHVTLQLLEYELSGVEVEEQATKHARERVYSLSGIDVSGIRASLHDLSDAISRTSGVHLREKGGLGSDYDLTISGLSGNAIRYFVDGVPLSTLGSGTTLANLPVALIDRIDIYKGVVPPDLGDDALGGAVNIITRRGRGSYLDASIGAGSFHTLKGDLNGQYVHPQSGFTVRPTIGVGLSRNDYIMRDVEVWNAERREYELQDRHRFHDGYRSIFGQVEAGFTDRSWADDAFVSLSGTHVHKEIQTGRKQTLVIGQATRQSESTTVALRYAKRGIGWKHLTLRLYGSYTWDHSLLADTALRAYAWDQSWMPSSYSEVTGRGPALRHYWRPQAVARLHASYTINDQNVVGLNYLINSTGNKRTDDFDDLFVPSDDQMTKQIIGLSHTGMYMGGRLSTSLFVKDYIFTALLRQQDFYWITGINEIGSSVSRNNVSYGAGMRYRVSAPLAIKVSYERGVRLPTTREFLGNGETIYPNLRLRPETAHNVNVGLYGTLLHRRHKLNYEVNLFGRDVQDYILLQNIAERQSQYDNVATARVLGAEAEIEYLYSHRWRVALNATYIDERNTMRTKPNGGENITYQNRMPNRPWFYTNAEASYTTQHPFGWERSRLVLQYAGQYTHHFYLTWKALGALESKSTIPAQWGHDLSATLYLLDDRYALSLECTNVTNERQYDNFMLQKPGRAFFAKLRWLIQ